MWQNNGNNFEISIYLDYLKMAIIINNNYNILTNSVTDYHRTLHFINVYIILFFIYNIDIFHFILSTDAILFYFSFAIYLLQICFFSKNVVNYKSKTKIHVIIGHTPFHNILYRFLFCTEDILCRCWRWYWIIKYSYFRTHTDIVSGPQLNGRYIKGKC